jgi:hypothetical protein
MTPTPAQVDRRVLGGFFFADAITGASILNPLTVSNTQLKVLGNRSGIYAILDAPGYSKFTNDFDIQSDWPATVGPSFEITVQDSSLHYLARRANVNAPQTAATLTTTQSVKLYPGPGGTVEPNWAVIRASVTDTSNNGLPWVMVQVIKSDNSIAATGMTDSRGEALLAVAGLGIQVSSSGSGAVTETTTPVTVKAWFDPSVLKQPAGWIPNPDDILGNLSSASLKTGSMTGAIGPRQILFAAIGISVS